jgi:quercetin dioxygenase-like cupin family protein
MARLYLRLRLSPEKAQHAAKASPETWPLNTLFPHPSHTDGQTEKAHGQMTADATVKAFKRAPSVEMSTWYKGILISSLATEQDTGGAFEFVVTRMKKGTEPPPHVHEREHEMFYVLEGMIDVYVGDECFRAAAFESRREKYQELAALFGQ